MFFKVLTILSVSVACVLSAPQHQEAARYPAGVNPQACPNFPICDNAALHGVAPQPQYYQQPQQHQQYDDGSYRGEDNGQYNHQYDDGQYQPQQYQHQQPQPQWNQYQSVAGPVNNHLTSAGGDK